MTAASPPVPTTRAAGPAVPPASHHVGFGHLMLAEWTKIRSVRSTFWTLLLFVLITVGITAGLTALVVGSWSHAQGGGGGGGGGGGHAQIIADPVGFILGVGIYLGQLTLCVLGAMVITSEYSTGVIRSSLLAVPRRTSVLAAKAAVFAAILLVLAEVVAFCSFFVGSTLLHSKVPVTLSDPGVTRAVVGAGLYLTVLGLFALAIGSLIRHTAGSITAVLGIVLVLPILTGLLPSSWGAHVNAYLPVQAGSLIIRAHPAAGQLLTAWQGFGLFCLWTAVLLAAGAYLLNRRDA